MRNEFNDAIKAISGTEAELLVKNRKSAGLFMCFDGEEYIGIDNSTGEAFLKTFDTESDCVSWLLSGEVSATA